VPVTIGVDVGGTKIAAGVVDEDGTIIAQRELATDAAEPNAIVSAINKLTSELRAVAPAATAIGIGAAALVDKARGMILFAPNLAWRDFPLGDLVAARAKMPVVVDNDANVATLGEAMYGAGRGGGDQVMLTVGTGIGGGIVINSELYRGVHGIGAELGHIVLDPHGPLCACGNHGCLEAFASGTALGRMGRERPSDAIVALAGGEEITGAHVGQAASDGDKGALELVREAGWWLGIGLVTLANTFDPERIVIGGGVAERLGDLLLGPARETLGDRVVGREWRPQIPVVPAALGNSAGLVGAAVLARSITKTVAI